MNRSSFVQMLTARLVAGLKMNNPSRGTSTIIWCDGEKVCYKRGGLRLYIEVRRLFDAYDQFKGKDVTTSQLKEMAPHIFDSRENGHNCHCTFFFMALQHMGVVEEIWGTGKRGKPFGVSIPLRPADRSSS